MQRRSKKGIAVSATAPPPKSLGTPEKGNTDSKEKDVSQTILVERAGSGKRVEIKSMSNVNQGKVKLEIDAEQANKDDEEARKLEAEEAAREEAEAQKAEQEKLAAEQAEEYRKNLEAEAEKQRMEAEAAAAAEEAERLRKEEE